MELNKIYNAECIEGMRGIESESIELILCDLPCGTTANSWDAIIPLEPLWEQYNRIIKPKGIICLTAAQPFTSLLVASNLKNFRCEWIWRKSRTTNFLNAKKQPLRVRESVLIFYKQPGGTYNPKFTQGAPYRVLNTSAASNKGNYGSYPTYITESDGRRYPVSVLSVNNETQTIHPTQKPLELFEYLIRTYSNPGDLVLDNCMGSGTTAVAARQLGRHFIGFEISPEYHRLALDRLAVTQLS